MSGSRPNVRRTRSGLISGRCLTIAGLTGVLLFGCNLDGGEPEPAPESQPQPVASAGATPSVVAGEKPPVSAAPEPQPQQPPQQQPQPAASAAHQPTPDRPAEIDQLRDENRQLMQALEVTLANQRDLANQLRKTNEALSQIRSDVALVRERLHDLELAQESHPLSQQHAAGVAQER